MHRPPDDEDDGLGTGQAFRRLFAALRRDLALLGRRILALLIFLLSGMWRTLGRATKAATRAVARWRTKRAAQESFARRTERHDDGAALPEPEPEPTPAVPPAPPVRRRKRFVFLRIAGVTLLAGVAVVGGVLVWALYDMDFSVNSAAATEPTIILETLDGERFATKGPFRGTPMEPGALPPTLTAAVIAVEDRRFRSHPGVDPIGILRASWVNLRAGGIVEGASTITQQLARLQFLSQERTFRRKLREIALAIWIDATETKEEILARYMSSIYLGGGAWGMPAAAELYFGKKPEELSLTEAAVLAGLIRAPSELNPRSDLEAARGRASVVLDLMVRTGAITSAEAESAKAAKIELRRSSINERSGGWFADWVHGQAAEMADNFSGPLYVRTTLHPKVQSIAEEAVASVMDEEGEGKKASEAALIAMLPDGAVLALVGGRDYAESQFDRATEAMRQPGSTFKPFVYLAALREGWSMRDAIRDEPVEVDGWSPENYSGRYSGQVTLAEALAQSLNAATVRLGLEIGPDRVVDAARMLGIDSKLEPTPSLALGTSEVTLIDLTAAYAAIVHGSAVEPFGIAEFGTDRDRRYRLKRPEADGAGLDPKIRDELVGALQLVVERGTGRAARLDGFAAGKTGTTQDYRDAWFVGFNGPFVAGVWVGNDDNSPMDGVTGGDIPARIWQRFMGALMQMVAEGDPLLKPVDARPASAEEAKSGAPNKSEQRPACNVAACERAYRSFRRSDCTFQPYSGPRKLCTK